LKQYSKLCPALLLALVLNERLWPLSPVEGPAGVDGLLMVSSAKLVTD